MRERTVTIGFIGLGQMGHPIALNLHKAGHDVLCFDSGKPDGIGSEGQGLALAASLAELAGCDTVFLCLPNGAIVEDVRVRHRRARGTSSQGQHHH